MRGDKEIKARPLATKKRKVVGKGGGKGVMSCAKVTDKKRKATTDHGLRLAEKKGAKLGKRK